MCVHIGTGGYLCTAGICMSVHAMYVSNNNNINMHVHTYICIYYLGMCVIQCACRHICAQLMIYTYVFAFIRTAYYVHTYVILYILYYIYIYTCMYSRTPLNDHLNKATTLEIRPLWFSPKYWLCECTQISSGNTTTSEFGNTTTDFPPKLKNNLTYTTTC